MIEDVYLPLQPRGHHQPRAIIVHAIGEYIDTEARDYTAHAWLEKLGLSAHVIVMPDGTAIRCIEDEQIAWHAKGLNTGRLGIEIVVPGLHNYESFLKAIACPGWCPEPAFETAVDIVGSWAQLYGIPEARIRRHSDVDPGRKQDPGAGFDWERFLSEVTGD